MRRTTLDAFGSSVRELGTKLEGKTFEKALAPPLATTPLLDRALERRQDVVDVEGLRWQIKKKDEEYAKVFKVAKENKDLITTLKVSRLFHVFNSGRCNWNASGSGSRPVARARPWWTPTSCRRPSARCRRK